VHVRVIDAVGVAVYGRIRGKFLPRLAVSRVSVSTTRPLASQFGGPVDATVQYSVTNTGNENLKPTITVSLSPLLGSGPKTTVHLPQILPGSTVTFSHTFGGVSPFGDLTAVVTASRVGIQATGSSGAVVVPWGIVAVLAVLALLFVLRRRGRRRAGRKRGPAGVPA